MSQRELQLNDLLLPTADVTVKRAIDNNPFWVENLCDTGHIKLSGTALKYLREQLEEYDIWKGDYDC